MTLALAFALAALAGSIPFGYLIARRVTGLDVRTRGSGNIGATNVWRIAGPAAGLATGALDFLKGWGAVALLPLLVPDAGGWARVAAGLLAIAGHNWTPWLGGRGGRGVLTTAGVFLQLAWLPLATAVAGFLAVFAATRTVSLGSMTAAVLLPASAALLPGPWRDPAILATAVVAGALVVLRHLPNIRRLLAGTEPRACGPRRP